MKNQNHILHGYEPPSPPPGLRDRCLRAAHAAREQHNIDIWTRIWTSRSIRLAWAMCALVLMACHILISTPTKSPAITAHTVVSDHEISDLISLPRIDMRAQSPSAALALSIADHTKENPS